MLKQLQIKILLRVQLEYIYNKSIKGVFKLFCQMNPLLKVAPEILSL